VRKGAIKKWKREGKARRKKQLYAKREEAKAKKNGRGANDYGETLGFNRHFAREDLP